MTTSDTPSSSQISVVKWKRYVVMLIASALWLVYSLYPSSKTGFDIVLVGLPVASILAIWAIHRMCVGFATRVVPVKWMPHISRSVAWALALLILGCGVTAGHMEVVHHRVRSQVAVGSSKAYDLERTVDDYYTKNYAYPIDNRQAGIPVPGAITDRFVSRLTITNGTIVAIFGNKADARIAGQKFVLSPRREGDATQWSCMADVGTTVEAQYLPICCRPLASTPLSAQQYQGLCPRISSSLEH